MATRLVGLLLTMLVAMPLVPLPAGAQQAGTAAPGPVQLLTDDAGDVAAYGPAGIDLGGAPAGRMASADVTGLSVQETEASLVFVLGAPSIKSTGPETPAESSGYVVYFQQSDTPYGVQFVRSVEVDGSLQYYALLLAFDEPGARNGDGVSVLQFLDVTADEAAGTMTTEVLRDYLLDSNGAAPLVGHSLTGWRVYSGIRLRFGGLNLDGTPVQLDGNLLEVVDRMPDTGNGTVDLPIVLGLVQSGSAFLESPVPVRASNGEATTIVFSVDAENRGDKTERYKLELVGVPPAWDVRLPASQVELPAGMNVSFPVLVRIPFDHKHGSLTSFVVEMHGLNDASSVGRVRLGVRFTAVPQPAGHHNTLQLHSRSIGVDAVNAALATILGGITNEAYMNTLEEDVNDQKVPVQAFQSQFLDASSGVPKTQYQWRVSLSPSLQMGLDFDLSQTGHIQIPVATQLPVLQGVFDGYLVRYGKVPEDFPLQFIGPDDGLVLARIEPSSSTDFGPLASHTFESTITPLPASDLVPFEDQASMVLVLNLTFVRPDVPFGPHDPPALGTGGNLLLPLIDYHDPVDDLFSASAVALSVIGEQERLVNPGRTALYEMRLEDHGSNPYHMRFSVTGSNAQWAQILGDAEVHVESGNAATVRLAIAAPQDAAEGQSADLVVEAVSTDDQSVRSLARILTTVTTKADIPDEAAAVQGFAPKQKDSPGPDAAILAVAVFALAMLAVRRHR